MHTSPPLPPPPSLPNPLPQPAGGVLFIEEGVDITRPETLTPELFAGVTQIVSSVGAVFGRSADGQMGCVCRGAACPRPRRAVV